MNFKIGNRDRHLLETKWFQDNRGYWMNPRHESIYLHRAVLGLKKGDKSIVDHKNGNKSDNRRSNLRLCDTSKNGANRKNGSNNRVGFKGVHFFKRKNKYKAVIKVKGERMFLGHYDCPKQAAIAYDKAALKYFGQFAKTNIVKGGSLHA